MRRPFGVTLVAVIAWLSGLFQIIGGVFELFSPVPSIGIVSIVIGVVTILVSLGLFGGRNGARILMAIVFALNIAAAVYLAFAHPAQIWTAVGDALLPLIGLILLYSPKANAYFS